MIAHDCGWLLESPPVQNVRVRVKYTSDYTRAADFGVTLQSAMDIDLMENAAPVQHSPGPFRRRTTMDSWVPAQP